MKRKQEWLDQEVFWRDLCPFLFPKKRFPDALKERDEAMDLAVE
jgi:hypothetical protein